MQRVGLQSLETGKVSIMNPINFRKGRNQMMKSGVIVRLFGVQDIHFERFGGCRGHLFYLHATE